MQEQTQQQDSTMPYVAAAGELTPRKAAGAVARARRTRAASSAIATTARFQKFVSFSAAGEERRRARSFSSSSGPLLHQQQQHRQLLQQQREKQQLRLPSEKKSSNSWVTTRQALRHSVRDPESIPAQAQQQQQQQQGRLQLEVQKLHQNEEERLPLLFKTDGLSTTVAYKRIIRAVEGLIQEFEARNYSNNCNDSNKGGCEGKQQRKPMNWKHWPKSFCSPALRTVLLSGETVVAVAALIAAASLCIVCALLHQYSAAAAAAARFFFFLPIVIGATWLAYRSQTIEHLRAVSKLNEALQQFREQTGLLLSDDDSANLSCLQQQQKRELFQQSQCDSAFIGESAEPSLEALEQMPPKKLLQHLQQLQQQPSKCTISTDRCFGGVADEAAAHAAALTEGSGGSSSSCCCYLPAASLIWVLRDAQWKQVPLNMVAAGDIFKLLCGEVFPCAAVRVLPRYLLSSLDCHHNSSPELNRNKASSQIVKGQYSNTNNNSSSRRKKTCLLSGAAAAASAVVVGMKKSGGTVVEEEDAEQLRSHHCSENLRASEEDDGGAGVDFCGGGAEAEVREKKEGEEKSEKKKTLFLRTRRRLVLEPVLEKIHKKNDVFFPITCSASARVSRVPEKTSTHSVVFVKKHLQRTQREKKPLSFDQKQKLLLLLDSARPSPVGTDFTTKNKEEEEVNKEKGCGDAFLSSAKNAKRTNSRGHEIKDSTNSSSICDDCSTKVLHSISLPAGFFSAKPTKQQLQLLQQEADDQAEFTSNKRNSSQRTFPRQGQQPQQSLGLLMMRQQWLWRHRRHPSLQQQRQPASRQSRSCTGKNGSNRNSKHHNRFDNPLFGKRKMNGCLSSSDDVTSSPSRYSFSEQQSHAHLPPPVQKALKSSRLTAAPPQQQRCSASTLESNWSAANTTERHKQIKADAQDESIHPLAAKIAPVLAEGFFIALHTSCVPTLRSMLQVSSSSHASPKSRASVPFFENAALVCRKVALVWLFACIISCSFVILWDIILVANYSSELSLSWRSMRWQFPVSLTLCMLMTVPRLLGEVTDVWGNARLQSLFQEARRRAATTAAAAAAGGMAGTAALRSLSTSSWSTDAYSSANSSVSSAVSVSSVPISRQIRRLLYIFRQGLDGSSNLLHVLNSTTVLAFVDKDGLLVDVHRTLQEIAVGAAGCGPHTPAAAAAAERGASAAAAATSPPQSAMMLHQSHILNQQQQLSIYQEDMQKLLEEVERDRLQRTAAGELTQVKTQTRDSPSFILTAPPHQKSPQQEKNLLLEQQPCCWTWKDHYYQPHPNLPQNSASSSFPSSNSSNKTDDKTSSPSLPQQQFTACCSHHTDVIENMSHTEGIDRILSSNNSIKKSMGNNQSSSFESKKNIAATSLTDHQFLSLAGNMQPQKSWWWAQQQASRKTVGGGEMQPRTATTDLIALNSAPECCGGPGLPASSTKEQKNSPKKQQRLSAVSPSLHELWASQQPHPAGCSSSSHAFSLPCAALRKKKREDLSTSAAHAKKSVQAELFFAPLESPQQQKTPHKSQLPELQKKQPQQLPHPPNQQQAYFACSPSPHHQQHHQQQLGLESACSPKSPRSLLRQDFACNQELSEQHQKKIQSETFGLFGCCENEKDSRGLAVLHAEGDRRLGKFLQKEPVHAAAADACSTRPASPFLQSHSRRRASSAEVSKSQAKGVVSSSSISSSCKSSRSRRRMQLKRSSSLLNSLRQSTEASCCSSSSEMHRRHEGIFYDTQGGGIWTASRSSNRVKKETVFLVPSTNSTTAVGSGRRCTKQQQKLHADVSREVLEATEDDHACSGLLFKKEEADKLLNMPNSRLNEQLKPLLLQQHNTQRHSAEKMLSFAACNRFLQQPLLHALALETPDEITHNHAPVEFRKVVLDFMTDETSPAGIRFENDSWLMHKAQIFPLALAMANTQMPPVQPPTFADPSWLFTLHVQDILLPHTSRRASLDELLDCQCSLAKLIGLPLFFLRKFLPLRFALAVKTERPLLWRSVFTTTNLLLQGPQINNTAMSSSISKRAGSSTTPEKTRILEKRRKVEKKTVADREELSSREERTSPTQAKKGDLHDWTRDVMDVGDFSRPRQSPKKVAALACWTASSRGKLQRGGEKKSLWRSRRLLQKGMLKPRRCSIVIIRSRKKGCNNSSVTPCVRQRRHFHLHQQQQRQVLFHRLLKKRSRLPFTSTTYPPPSQSRLPSQQLTTTNSQSSAVNLSNKRPRQNSHDCLSPLSTVKRLPLASASPSSQALFLQSSFSSAAALSHKNTQKNFALAPSKMQTGEVAVSEAATANNFATTRDHPTTAAKMEGASSTEDEEAEQQKKHTPELMTAVKVVVVEDQPRLQRKREGKPKNEARFFEADAEDEQLQFLKQEAAAASPLLLCVLRDEMTEVVHLFVKALPPMLLPRIKYYYDGQQLRPFETQALQSLLELNAQWLSTGLDAVAFGYRPLQKSQQELLLEILKENSLFSVYNEEDLLRERQHKKAPSAAQVLQQQKQLLLLKHWEAEQLQQQQPELSQHHPQSLLLQSQQQQSQLLQQHQRQSQTPVEHELELNHRKDSHRFFLVQPQGTTPPFSDEEGVWCERQESLQQEQLQYFVQKQQQKKTIPSDESLGGIDEVKQQRQPSVLLQHSKGHPAQSVKIRELQQPHTAVVEKTEEQSMHSHQQQSPAAVDAAEEDSGGVASVLAEIVFGGHGNGSGGGAAAAADGASRHRLAQQQRWHEEKGDTCCCVEEAQCHNNNHKEDPAPPPQQSTRPLLRRLSESKQALLGHPESSRPEKTQTQTNPPLLEKNSQQKQLAQFIFRGPVQNESETAACCLQNNAQGSLEHTSTTRCCRFHQHYFSNSHHDHDYHHDNHHQDFHDHHHNVHNHHHNDHNHHHNDHHHHHFNDHNHYHYNNHNHHHYNNDHHYSNDHEAQTSCFSSYDHQKNQQQEFQAITAYMQRPFAQFQLQQQSCSQPPMRQLCFSQSISHCPYDAPHHHQHLFNDSRAITQHPNFLEHPNFLKHPNFSNHQNSSKQPKDLKHSNFSKHLNFPKHINSSKQLNFFKHPNVSNRQNSSKQPDYSKHPNFSRHLNFPKHINSSKYVNFSKHPNFSNHKNFSKQPNYLKHPNFSKYLKFPKHINSSKQLNFSKHPNVSNHQKSSKQPNYFKHPNFSRHLNFPKHMNSSKCLNFSKNPNFSNHQNSSKQPKDLKHSHFSKHLNIPMHINFPRKTNSLEEPKFPKEPNFLEQPKFSKEPNSLEELEISKEPNSLEESKFPKELRFSKMQLGFGKRRGGCYLLSVKREKAVVGEQLMKTKLAQQQQRRCELSSKTTRSSGRVMMTVEKGWWWKKVEKVKKKKKQEKERKKERAGLLEWTAKKEKELLVGEALFSAKGQVVMLHTTTAAAVQSNDYSRNPLGSHHKKSSCCEHQQGRTQTHPHTNNQAPFFSELHYLQGLSHCQYRQKLLQPQGQEKKSEGEGGVRVDYVSNNCCCCAGNFCEKEQRRTATDAKKNKGKDDYARTTEDRGGLLLHRNSKHRAHKEEPEEAAAAGGCCGGQGEGARAAVLGAHAVEKREEAVGSKKAGGDHRQHHDDHHHEYSSHNYHCRNNDDYYYYSSDNASFGTLADDCEQQRGKSDLSGLRRRRSSDGGDFEEEEGEEQSAMRGKAIKCFVREPVAFSSATATTTPTVAATAAGAVDIGGDDDSGGVFGDGCCWGDALDVKDGGVVVTQDEGRRNSSSSGGSSSSSSSSSRSGSGCVVAAVAAAQTAEAWIQMPCHVGDRSAAHTPLAPLRSIEEDFFLKKDKHRQRRGALLRGDGVYAPQPPPPQQLSQKQQQRPPPHSNTERSPPEKSPHSASSRTSKSPSESGNQPSPTQTNKTPPQKTYRQPERASAKRIQPNQQQTPQQQLQLSLQQLQQSEEKKSPQKKGLVGNSSSKLPDLGLEGLSSALGGSFGSSTDDIDKTDEFAQFASKKEAAAACLNTSHNSSSSRRHSSHSSSSISGGSGTGHSTVQRFSSIYGNCGGGGGGEKKSTAGVAPANAINSCERHLSENGALKNACDVGAGVTAAACAQNHTISMMGPPTENSQVTGATTDAASDFCRKVTVYVAKHEGAAGKLLRRLQDNLILLGLSASKQLCPKEVAERIQDLHEAGIRFVFFSPQNEKRTRALGNAFGLETGWNSIISLQPSLEDSSYVNMEGKVVLPSSIAAIQKHVAEVDNVPLQVSLFCNASPETVQQMMQILQENNEVMLCIGSSLRASNFELFRQANASIATLIAPAAACSHCLGRCTSPPMMRQCCCSCAEKPTAALLFASNLNSLPCALQQQNNYCVADPHVTMDLLYEAFRESRRVVDCIQQLLTFCVAAGVFLACFPLLNSLVLLPPLQDVSSLLLLLLLVIPALALSLLCNSKTDKLMREYPFKPLDKSQISRRLLTVFLHFSCRVLPAGVVISCLSFAYMYDVGKEVHAVLLEQLKQTLATMPTAPNIRSTHLSGVLKQVQVHCRDFAFSSSWLQGQWLVCEEAMKRAGRELSDGWDEVLLTPVVLGETFCFLSGGITLMIFSLAYLDRFESLTRVSPLRNRCWIAVCCLLLLVLAATAAIKVTSHLDRCSSFPVTAFQPAKAVALSPAAAAASLNSRRLQASSVSSTIQSSGTFFERAASACMQAAAQKLVNTEAKHTACLWSQKKTQADDNLSKQVSGVVERMRGQQKQPDFRRAGLQWPHWGIWLVLGLLWLSVILVDEAVKRAEYRQHERHQKYLRVLFATRLGMWSPK